MPRTCPSMRARRASSCSLLAVYPCSFDIVVTSASLADGAAQEDRDGDGERGRPGEREQQLGACMEGAREGAVVHHAGRAVAREQHGEAARGYMEHRRLHN